MARRETRAVNVGNVRIGAGAPVVIQSMTTTTALEPDETLTQLIELQRAGCQLVRIAVPSLKAAKALAPLREQMRRDQITIPLAADVHFQPAAALEAALHVEKVRINPGNYAPDPAAARQYLSPLLARLRERGAALRIGVNHGSLAPHIVEQFGNGPEGMVASAMEYLFLCREEQFDQVIVALKASNPYLMVTANRLLATEMDRAGFDFPFHLGVTEAGEGTEGELRSAVGIGALLIDGIGDTIRVSLTGDPALEIDACRRLLSAVATSGNPLPAPVPVPVPTAGSAAPKSSIETNWRDLAFGGQVSPRVEQDYSLLSPSPDSRLEPLNFSGSGIESICLSDFEISCSDNKAALQRTLMLLHLDRDQARRVALWLSLPESGFATWRGGTALLAETATAFDGIEFACSPTTESNRSQVTGMLQWLVTESPWRFRHKRELLIRYRISFPATADWLTSETMAAGFAPPAFLIDGAPRLPACRAFQHLCFESLPAGERPLLGVCLSGDLWRDAAVLGPLLLDRQIDFISAPSSTNRSDAWQLLQATGSRITRAEFISCPGCGRLQYDLTETVQRIKRNFGHLTGVKIAVMGCIVNGPGEMADADFGYVGRSTGTVDLYAGGRKIGEGLTLSAADAALVALLRQRGLWREPPCQLPD